MLKVLLFLFSISLATWPAHAAEKKLFFAAGLISQNTLRVSGGASGTPGIGTIYPELNLNFALPIGNGFHLSPWVLYTPMLRMSKDGGETMNILAWSLRLKKDLAHPVAAYLGLGEMIYRMAGTGGTTTLNNGNGQSSFGLPSGTAASTLFSISAWLEFSLSEVLRLDIDLMGVDTFSSKRAFNTTVSLGYGLL